MAARYDIVTAGENRATVVANSVCRWLCKLMQEREIALSATAGNFEKVPMPPTDLNDGAVTQ